jgi:hypothetical protein
MSFFCKSSAGNWWGIYLQCRVVVKYSDVAVVHMHTVSKESKTLMHSMKQSVLDLQSWAYLQHVAVLGWLSQMQVHYISKQPQSTCSHSSIKQVIHFYWVMCTYTFVPRDISDHVPTLSDCFAELHAKCQVHLTCKLHCNLNRFLFILLCYSNAKYTTSLLSWLWTIYGSDGDFQKHVTRCNQIRGMFITSHYPSFLNVMLVE